MFLKIKLAQGELDLVTIRFGTNLRLFLIVTFANS